MSIELFKHYKAMAKKGFANEQFRVGWCYANRKGTPRDDVQAVFWYRKAAEKGNADAQQALGACYASGIGVPKNQSQAQFWRRKAAVFWELRAQQGDAKSQYDLSSCYEYGLGVPIDKNQATFWKRKATKQGYNYKSFDIISKASEFQIFHQFTDTEYKELHSQYIIGLKYLNGEGKLKDYAKGMDLVYKLAEQGFTIALKHLSGIFYSGFGVTKDKIEAYAITNLICAYDDDIYFIEEELDWMENEMSYEEIMRGQQRTREWQKKIDERQNARDVGD